MKNLFVPYTYVNKALRTQATKYTGSDLVTDILARETALPVLPVLYQGNLVSYSGVFELCVNTLTSLLKDSRKKYLDELLGNPAEGESAGYPTQLADAKSYLSEADNTDIQILARIDNRLKSSETRSMWATKVTKVKADYYAYVDSLATGVVRRALDKLDMLELAEGWEFQLGDILKVAKAEKTEAMKKAKEYYEQLKAST